VGRDIPFVFIFTKHCRGLSLELGRERVIGGMDDSALGPYFFEDRLLKPQMQFVLSLKRKLV